MDSKNDDEKRILMFLLLGIFIISSLFAAYSLHFNDSDTSGGDMITGAAVKDGAANLTDRGRFIPRNNPIIKKIRLTK